MRGLPEEIPLSRPRGEAAGMEPHSQNPCPVIPLSRPLGEVAGMESQKMENNPNPPKIPEFSPNIPKIPAFNPFQVPLEKAVGIQG